MALQGPFEWDGQTYPEAYARALYCNLTVELAQPYVAVYKDKADREQNPGKPLAQLPFDTGNTETFPNGVTFQRIYDYLKTQPVFAGWVDA